MILYQLWTCERACVLSFDPQAASEWERRGGRVTHTEYRYQFERAVREADDTIGEWLARAKTPAEQEKCT